MTVGLHVVTMTFQHIQRHNIFKMMDKLIDNIGNTINNLRWADITVLLAESEQGLQDHVFIQAGAVQNVNSILIFKKNL